MQDHNRLSKAMKSALGTKGIHEIAASGEFAFPALKPILFPGAVYGFAVSLSENDRRAFFEEATIRGGSRLATLEDFRPVEGSLYPLYWGKDKQLGARPYQHIGNPKGTGSIRLSTYSTLIGKRIVCASIVVPDNVHAEQILQSVFPDILKTSTVVYDSNLIVL